jgi:hypothetical protein
MVENDVKLFRRRWEVCSNPCPAECSGFNSKILGDVTITNQEGAMEMLEGILL